MASARGTGGGNPPPNTAAGQAVDDDEEVDVEEAFLRQLDMADEYDRSGLAALALAGDRFRRGERARTKIANVIVGGQGFVARVVAPSGVLADQPLPPPDPTQAHQPAGQTALQQAVHPTAPQGSWFVRNRRAVLITAAALVVGIIVGAIAWGVISGVAGGDHEWANNGALGFGLVVCVAALVTLVTAAVVFKEPAAVQQPTTFVVTTAQGATTLMSGQPVVVQQPAPVVNVATPPAPTATP